jgi:sugar phosphate isomerase/epimerase
MTTGNSSLPRLKGRFPFRLAAPSWVMPAAILPNLEVLAPLVDEAALILFQSRESDALPTPAEIREFAAFGSDAGLGFSVHLPLDIQLGHENPAERRLACDTVLRVLELTAPLAPTVNVLHIERFGWQTAADPGFAPWLERVGGSLDALLAGGADPAGLAVESLNYPLHLVAGAVRERGMRFCLDIGHVVKHDLGMHAHLRDFAAGTAIYHVHGVRGVEGEDHLGLDKLDDPWWPMVADALRGFAGTVCLEVFDLDRLRDSLKRMEELLP